MIKTQEDFFIKIFTSHFIARVRKGCSRFACERELEIEHYWNILTPYSYGCHIVSFLFSWCSTGGLGAHSAGWPATSYQQLLRSPNSIGVPKGPLGRVWLPYHILSPTASDLQLNCLLFNSSALYYLQTPTQRYGHTSTPPQFLPISGDWDVSLLLSLEWPVWSSSSGNNCHAVHRLLSSGASVYECTMGIFFSSSHFISQFPPTRFPFITAIRMCHLLLVHHLGMAFLAGSKGQNIIFPTVPKWCPWKFWGMRVRELWYYRNILFGKKQKNKLKQNKKTNKTFIHREGLEQDFSKWSILTPWGE